MIEKSLVIQNKLGLHARPAALLVQETSKFEATVELESDGLKVNGKSIMGVMMLAAAHGSKVKVYAEGNDAEQALEALEALFDRKFDEE